MFARLKSAFLGQIDNAEGSLIECFHRGLIVFCGLLLIFAGMSKVHPAGGLPIGRFFDLPAPYTRVLGVAETVLGCIVLCGHQNLLVWTVLQATFLSYLASLAAMYISGARSCACIAAHPLPLYRIAIVDVMVVVGLWFDRRFWRVANEKCARASSLGRCLTFAALAACILAIIGFGSVGAAMAYCGGSTIIAEQPQIHFGTLEGGKEKVVWFRLHNFSTEPITVVGAQTSCSCVGIDDLPLRIPAKGSIDMSLRIQGFPRASNYLMIYIADLAFSRDIAPVRLQVTAIVTNARSVSSSFSGKDKVVLCEKRFW